MALSHANPPELQLGHSTAAWFAAFIVTCACLRRRSFDFNNRLISLLHALISSGVAIYYVAMRPLSIGAPSTPGQTFTLTLSCGYFLYDFITATVYETVHGSCLKAITLHINTAAQYMLQLLLVCAYIHRGMHDTPQSISCFRIVKEHIRLGPAKPVPSYRYTIWFGLWAVQRPMRWRALFVVRDVFNCTSCSKPCHLVPVTPATLRSACCCQTCCRP
eukprot:14987-Heterococcus_DN1.PRE.2